MDFVQPIAEFPAAGRLAPAHKVLQRFVRPRPVFALHTVDSPQRAGLEAYIAEQFDAAYHARITGYLPLLLSMQCQGRYSAVAGLRPATDGPLFIERYLDRPIEAELAARSDTPVARRDIFEVGNLVATHRGVSQLFFAILAAVAHRAEVRWAVFSATDKVARIIRKMNFIAYPLAKSDPARLGDEAGQWGRYYDTGPVVLAVDVEATVARLRESLLADAAMSLFGRTIRDLARRLRTANSR